VSQARHQKEARATHKARPARGKGPNPMYRLVLFDLDGTLLTGAREVNPANAAAVAGLMARGIRVGLATGRTARSVDPFCRLLELNGPHVLFNGARVVDPLTGEWVHRRDLPRAEALFALQLACEFPGMHVNLYVGDEILIAQRSERSRESEVKDGVPHTMVGDLGAWLAGREETPVKLMLIAEPEQLERFAARYRAKGFSTTLVRSEWNYLELMAEGVSKGGALRAIETAYGIGCAQMVAFGDSLNDLELLSSCGLGVAMGNAHPKVQAIAHRVIGHHETDAIARCLEEVFAP
jgi:Cof subfamily protein (haloacid dehalogenase superfamily)